MEEAGGVGAASDAQIITEENVASVSEIVGAVDPATAERRARDYAALEQNVVNARAKVELMMAHAEAAREAVVVAEAELAAAKEG